RVGGRVPVRVALQHHLHPGDDLRYLVRPGGKRLVVQVDPGVLVRRQWRAGRQGDRERKVAVRLLEGEDQRLGVRSGQSRRQAGLVRLEVPGGVVVRGVRQPLLQVRRAAGEVRVE